MGAYSPGEYFHLYCVFMCMHIAGWKLVANHWRSNLDFITEGKISYVFFLVCILMLSSQREGSSSSSFRDCRHCNHRKEHAHRELYDAWKHLRLTTFPSRHKQPTAGSQSENKNVPLILCDTCIVSGWASYWLTAILDICKQRMTWNISWIAAMRSTFMPIVLHPRPSHDLNL